MRRNRERMAWDGIERTHLGLFGWGGGGDGCRGGS